MGLSLKLAAVSATVLSTAVMLKLLAPVMAISDLPSIWTAVISWLKPPYLYVVINCIIITIVASSRLQSKLDDSPSLAVLLPTEPVKIIQPVVLPEPPFHGGLFPNESVKIVTASYTSSPEFVRAPEPDFSTPQFTDEYNYEDIKDATQVYESITKHSVNTPVKIAAASYNSSPKFVQVPEPDYGTHDEFGNEDMKVAYEEITKNPSKISFPVEKPPASARFSHRKPAKAAAEGGRTLGVAKTKRQDTLEATWKTITEGRSVPLTRHLRKSDTWETHGQGRHSSNTEESPTDQRMTKSDTFDVNRGGGSSRKPPAPPSKLSRSGGSGKLRKDPSLGQEELNRRVEAFIKKVNEDMRLQRQESLNQYMEMINRGAH